MTPKDLLPTVYPELRRLAAARLAAERPGHTLDATALVHEAFLKLGGERSFASRTDYLRAAAAAMRRILIDHARARNAAKRNSGKRVDLDPDQLAESLADERIETLDEALKKFSALQPQVAELVELHRFGGLTLAECAAALGVSPRTADAWWAYARAWLAVELKDA